MNSIVRYIDGNLTASATLGQTNVNESVLQQMKYKSHRILLEQKYAFFKNESVMSPLLYLHFI